MPNTGQDRKRTALGVERHTRRAFVSDLDAVPGTIEAAKVIVIAGGVAPSFFAVMLMNACCRSHPEVNNIPALSIISTAHAATGLGTLASIHWK
jgi:hypothetical protein